MDTSRRITRNQRQSRHTRWTKNKACSNTVAHPMDTEKLVRADILQQTCVCDCGTGATVHRHLCCKARRHTGAGARPVAAAGTRTYAQEHPMAQEHGQQQIQEQEHDQGKRQSKAESRRSPNCTRPCRKQPTFVQQQRTNHDRLLSQGH